MITKVVIAAAGQGTRMLELSKNKSKHLIEVKNRPFIAYLMDNLLMAGYSELILVVGFKNELMEEFVKNYTPPADLKKEDYKITIVNQCEILGSKEKMYGTVCPLMCTKEIIGSEPFLFIFGDGLYSPEDLKAMDIDDNYSYVAGISSNHPEKYGVLFCDGNGFLIKKIEKPKEFVGNLIDPGLYKLTSEIFKYIYKVEKSARGEYELSDALNLLAKEKLLKIKKIESWHDFGNPEDVKKMSKFLEYENCGIKPNSAE